MNYRQKISTRLKFLVHMNAAPPVVMTKLHRTQICRYRQSFNYNEYLGHELDSVEEKIMEQMKLLHQRETERQITEAVIKVGGVVRAAVARVRGYKNALKKYRNSLVRVYDRYKGVLSADRLAKLVGVSESTIRQWTVQVKNYCGNSLSKLCHKRHPNQLTNDEVNTMKEFLSAEAYKHWPLVSVYYAALNSGTLSMAISTWYKYAGLLNISRWKPIPKEKFGVSVVATRPNEYWHADVTHYRTGNGVLHYIYLVVDNYSKMILGKAVSTKLCAEIRLETFKSAIGKAYQSFANLEPVSLIVDGGSENNNQTVDDFIAGITEFELTKEIALKTVHFSNAMAEAANRLLKSYYLHHLKPWDTAELISTLEFAEKDICENRPHGRLHGLTPCMAYSGVKPNIELHTILKSEARISRVQWNQNAPCCEMTILNRTLD